MVTLRNLCMLWPESFSIYDDGYFERNVGYTARYRMCNVSRSGVRLMFNFSLHCKVFQLCHHIMILFRRNRAWFFFILLRANWFCWFINLLFQWPDSVADTIFFLFSVELAFFFFMDEKCDWQALNWFVFCCDRIFCLHMNSVKHH